MPAQQINIPLVVIGVDLDDEPTLELDGTHFGDLIWHSESGQVIATPHNGCGPAWRGRRSRRSDKR